MTNQFLGRAFHATIIGLTLLFLASFLSVHTATDGVMLVLIGLITFILSIHKLELGLYIALAELIGTSHGHLLSLGEISLRMAVFIVVMLAWLTHLARGERPQLKASIMRPYILLFATVALGFFTGLSGRPFNSIADVVSDGNGYIYLLYILPMLTVSWDALKKRTLLQVFAGATTFVAALTLVILYLFTHMSEPIQRVLYAFFRDARVAELTRVVGDIFRVFLQAQFFVMAGALVLIAAAVWLWQNRRDQQVIAYGLIIFASTLIISLSRSFWIGFVAGGATLFIAVYTTHSRLIKLGIKTLVLRLLAGFYLIISAVALLWLVLAFPFPPGANVSGFGDLLSERALDGSDAAISSRWNLLPAMMDVIAEHPIIGSGFGTIVAFESDDPRVREIYPDGLWRTYAFEWGWLDAWLKMGLLGPIALIWLGVTVSLGLIRGFNTAHGWLQVGLFASLVALFVTHVFSPYLNHPIGLGFIIFLTPFLIEKTKQAPEGARVAWSEFPTGTGVRSLAQIPQMPSASSLQVEPRIDPS